MSDLQSGMGGLSPAKSALLERKLRDKAVRQEREPIRRGSAGETPELSFGQQRLWFIDQWQPASAAYNISNLFRVEGRVDIATLNRAVSEIVRRHETLRTTFDTQGTTPVQIIHSPAPAAALHIDLSETASEQKEAEARMRILEESMRPFDLRKIPLFRCALVTLDPDKHLLLFTIHHIVADGWSLGVLYRELSALYSAFAADQPSPLQELPIQYSDFAVWQRRHLQGEIVAEQLNYWREQLRDLPTLDMPTDHPRPLIQTFAGSAIHARLPRPLIDSLKSLARQEGTTLFMTLLAAFQTLLHRYTGQDDIVVGAPIAGRTRVELEPLIGCLINMLVLRTATSGDPSFRELLGRVKKVAIGAYAYQEVPFEKLVEEVQPRRDTSRNPLFQVVFVLRNTPGYSLSLGTARAERVTTDKLTIRFDLEVHLLEKQGGLDAMFIYNTALFESGTITRMARHFETLLEGVVADPEQRLSQLPILSPEEKQLLLVTWNQTDTDYPRSASIHELFAAQVKAFPDNIAVEFGTQSLTYRQLNERSNQLAHRLRTLGAGPDALVGICAERSVDMIVGFLGTLKSGGAYVPLDPSYPRERLAFMIEDAKVGVLLTQQKLCSQFAEIAARVVCLDTEPLDTFSRDDPSAVGTSENLAYVIYTSGSTGLPKGVAVPHRAVTRVVLNTNYVHFSPSDRMTQVCNASFDVSAFEIWGALLNGGTLIGIPQDVLLSPRNLARAIQYHRITNLFLVPALFNQMAMETPTAFRSLRYLVVGGDVCDPKSARRILEEGAPQHFLNAYGPTEAAVFAICHRIDHIADSATSVPIGRPISNTRVFVLDRNLQPVPIGIVGELYIGGDAVAREYLNRPELTAERFIRDPFSHDPAARLYRTGDFVRYLADGTIDFIGRMDQQVKIRGYRIELQEIERVLSEHPAVSTGLVIAKQKSESEKRLVAYVVPSGRTPVSTEDLLQFLRAKLPEYMVPSAFITLQSVPLTPNGKVDQAALPDCEGVAEGYAQRFVGPRTSVEESLGEMWKELLGISPVSMDDNFFSLGGHSLLAMRLIARIEKVFEINLPVATLFQYPTIAELARVLESEALPQSWSSLIPLRTEGSRLPFFWIHGDSSNGILPEYLGPDQPLYGLEHQAHDGNPAAHTRVETISKYYLDEVRKVRPAGPYFLGGFSFGALVAFEMAQQLKRDGADVPLLFMLDPPCFEKEGEAAPRSATVWQEFTRHWREISRRRGREKLEYVVPRLKGQFIDGWWFTEVARKLRWKCCLLAGRRLPLSLRSAYILDVYAGALRLYLPKPYADRVVIYKSKNACYPPSMNWFELLTGDRTVLESPGRHMDLRSEPYVAEWVEALKASLDEVQLHGK